MGAGLSGPDSSAPKERATERLQPGSDTTPQKKLGHRARRQNLHGAFQASEGVRGAVIVLVDDIYTTGNTISGAAKALKEAGAEKVYFLTISIGQGY